MSAHSSNSPVRKNYLTSFSRRALLKSAGAFGLASVAGTGLAACGSSGQGGAGSITWSVWGNPGEVKRLQEFTDDFNKRNAKAKARLISVPTASYEQKLLTQLSGNTAPDVFYTGDTLIARLIKNKSILELTERLNSKASESPPDQFFDGLWGAAKEPGGKIYGVPVDCNPAVIWFNKKVLTEAGITRTPAELFEAGEWTRDAFQDLAEKIHASGKRAAALGSDWMSVYSWMTSNGGKIYEDGKFVAHEDPKSTEAFAWMREMIASKLFIYAGSLPEGQGQEALFMSNNVGFAISVGRWVLPLFKQNKNLDYDIVPYPSPDSKMPVTPVAAASLVINKEAKDVNAAFTFLTQFVSKKGQEFRLSDAGNAVPSVPGPDNVVLEGGLPEHAKYFLELRQKGYSLPIEEARTPGLSEEISKRIDVVWTRGGDPATKLAEIGARANQLIAKAQGK
jgi:multiple sugar transport system substrate-binding protein